MKLWVYHIGSVSFEQENSKRELKSIGGVSGYIVELIKYSIYKNINVGFIGKIYNSVPNDIYYYEIQNKPTSTNKFLLNLLIKSLFIKLPKDALVHAHRPDHLAVFSLMRNRKKILTLHGQQAVTINIRKGRLTRWLYNKLEKSAFKKSQAIIAVDPVTQRFYQYLYPQFTSKIYYIPTGIDTESFKSLDKSQIRSKYNYSEKDKIIIYVGRLDEPPKKVSQIIKAFSILACKDSNYKLIIIGDGNAYNNLQLLTDSFKLNDIIDFWGVRKRNELPELYNMADISVLYSSNEGSPLSVKESLACGIPVVANAVGDIPKIISHGVNGYIAKDENAENLSYFLQLAMKNSAEMKDSCINSIREYSSDNVYSKIINLYRTILDESK